MEEHTHRTAQPITCAHVRRNRGADMQDMSPISTRDSILDEG
ncbi:hypothetical protein SXCC_02859 [Gluconacetobacter sp. SXCC-1]|nr:hypothetical protein SXCC_02859 [Gluconacetobacter sp. SXCC-1]